MTMLSYNDDRRRMVLSRYVLTYIQSILCLHISIQGHNLDLPLQSDTSWTTTTHYSIVRTTVRRAPIAHIQQCKEEKVAAQLALPFSSSRRCISLFGTRHPPFPSSFGPSVLVPAAFKSF
ncbi:hypothetical protein OUZ56_007733 [Daphnia magna]|uniref:Uncharacterized protein n=1 Tax=Daphnia magna TaxID=35525 RepID=A0ABR0AB56_9CRUS|nr:hypothetical protein OUZ56_007733 [Daphnia magna]